MCCGVVPFLVVLVVVSCMTLSTPYEKSSFLRYGRSVTAPALVFTARQVSFWRFRTGCGMYKSHFAGDRQEWSTRLICINMGRDHQVKTQ